MLRVILQKDNMAKKKLSRDQKRKQKLGKRLRPSGAGGSRQAVLVEAFTQDTERVINDTFLSYGRGMGDADVLAALNQLVVDVQKRNLAKENVGEEPASAKTALIWNLKQHWTDERTLEPIPSLVAAQTLQSLAQHVESIMAPGESHSYLRFLQGVMQSAGSSPDALGTRVDLLSQGPLELPPERADDVIVGDQPLGGDWTEDERRLLDLGLQWIRNSTESTWTPLRDEAMRMTESGHAQEVANVCQYVYGLTQAGPVEMALRPVLDAAHQKLAELEVA